MIFTFIFTSNKWNGKLWVLNHDQKMDEGVKYLKVTYSQFAFILSAAEVSPFWTRCCIKRVKLIQSTGNLLRWILGEIPLHLGTRNSIAWKSPERYEILPWTRWRGLILLLLFFNSRYGILHYNSNMFFKLYISLYMVIP